MRLSVGESLLSGLVGVDGDVTLEDETERTVIGHIVPDPVEEDDDLIAARRGWSVNGRRATEATR